jgi:hypothetical protein
MESNREVFLRMSEEHYLSVPFEIRESFLASKRVDEEKGDWSENMKDSVYSHYYYEAKFAKKLLAEREYQLREERRKQLNK